MPVFLFNAPCAFIRAKGRQADFPHRIPFPEPMSRMEGLHEPRALVKRDSIFIQRGDELFHFIIGIVFLPIALCHRHRDFLHNFPWGKQHCRQCRHSKQQKRCRQYKSSRYLSFHVSSSCCVFKIPLALPGAGTQPGEFRVQ